MKALSIISVLCCAAVLQAEAGVVTVTSQANYTFQGDTTYYVTNNVTLTGITTFEGGTVIKYAPGASLSVSNVNWLATSYHPAILTAKDDNSVGVSIHGSTGNPSGYYANPALSFFGNPPSTWDMANFRIAYAQQAIIASCVSFTLSLYDGQIVNCADGINVPGQGNVLLRNLLFAGVQTAFNDPSYVNFDGQNITFGGLTNHVPSFLISTYNSGSRPFSFVFTNCIFANYYSYIQGGTQGPYQTLNGAYNGFWSFNQTPPAPFGDPSTQTIAPTGTAVFQTMGAGNYYLTNTSAFHGPATTSIDPALLSDLVGKTTTAPTNAPTPQPAGTTWSQLVPRDTTATDLGYHYDPLDYLITQYGVSGAPNVLTNGVSVGMYGGSGFVMQGGGGMTVYGLPAQMSHIVWYPSVQEEPVLLNNISTAGSAVFSIASVPSSVKLITLHYADLAMQGQTQPFFDIGAAYYFPIASLRDCWLREVALGVGNYYPGATSPGSSISLINNLLERSSANFFNGYALYYYGPNQYIVLQNPLGLTVYNNLFWQSSLGLTYAAAQQQYAMNWTIKDNLFDGTGISLTGDGNYLTYVADSNNGYSNSVVSGPFGGAGDVFLTALDYAPGPLGTRYIALATSTTSQTALIDAGSRTSAAAGLDDHTIEATLFPDTCTVDIGFHYFLAGDPDAPASPGNLIVSTNFTAQQLAQWLVGPNITVQNATFTGSPTAKGIFAGGTACHLPIDSGLMLASGNLTDAIGANSSLTSTGTPFGNEPGDADLDNIIAPYTTYTTQDAAVLEFDMTPQTGSITFNYFFASEEYPNYQTSYDDVCGIFIDGTNVALVPGTSMPISIFTVNSGSNASYFQNNPVAPPVVFNFQYNGLTTSLTAQASVTANTPHHVKIAVADTRDNVLDSAIFIQVTPGCN